MSRATMAAWQEQNREHLESWMGELARRLARFEGGEPWQESGPSSPADSIAEGMSAPPAIESLAATFGLSAFEIEVMLLCAGAELHAEVAQAVARLEPNGPTFALALGVLNAPHWAALSPNGPLRHWQLIEVEDPARITTSRLRLSEWARGCLLGMRELDARLATMVRPANGVAELPASHRRTARALAEMIGAGAEGCCVSLEGGSERAREAIVASAAENLGLSVMVVRTADLPDDPDAADFMARLWVRETCVDGGVLLVHSGAEEAPADNRFIRRLRDRFDTVLVLSGGVQGANEQRSDARLDVPRLGEEEAAACWESAWNDLEWDEPFPRTAVEQLVSNCDVDPLEIPGLLAETRWRSRTNGESGGRALMGVVQHTVVSDLGLLANFIEADASPEQLILPAQQKRLLDILCSSARQQRTVGTKWGFRKRHPRGLGVSALFHGTSGTGKTLASEVIATMLGTGLYLVDLSRVVSKYIGETEKNLERVFRAAERSGAVILFDEADALFGARTEVRDSHDRYANLEVSYLLARMERFDGVAILTTNRRDALDEAFQRRLRYVIEFPQPDEALRVEIWKRVFPADAPTQGLDFERLAGLQATGGIIQNIALTAAYLAAEAGGPITMERLDEAAGFELGKSGCVVPRGQIGNWNP